MVYGFIENELYWYYNSISTMFCYKETSIKTCNRFDSGDWLIYLGKVKGTGTAKHIILSCWLVKDKGICYTCYPPSAEIKFHPFFSLVSC